MRFKRPRNWIGLATKKTSAQESNAFPHFVACGAGFSARAAGSSVVKPDPNDRTNLRQPITTLLRMIQDVLSDWGGIGIYGIISVGLFFIVFSAALLWAFRIKKSYLNSMEVLPLNDESISKQPKGDLDHE